AMLAPEELRHADAERARRAQLFQVFAPAQVLADGDELHLGRDDAAARVVHLRHVAAGLRAARRALELETQLRELRIRKALTAVMRGRPFEQLGVAALFDPRRTQRAQPGADVDARGRVRVRPAG